MVICIIAYESFLICAYLLRVAVKKSLIYKLSYYALICSFPLAAFKMVSSVFGQILDQITDRLSTSLLYLLNSSVYEEYITCKKKKKKSLHMISKNSECSFYEYFRLYENIFEYTGNAKVWKWETKE
ncbi:hypothetical protein PFUGPA_03335 [Plasmodium falciparum Palo Alto/Uganda]|uniref:Uncharacterized protein n=1 Tax=Plasmodium falciparum (isolate Palo Alto / Uganda) TaxID=57270 RepID=W4IZF7_PLAFP|nr:hypothetical protein PFUGPA_03335 [Plasmodium falciparum Palo Alto/Uganda]